MVERSRMWALLLAVSLLVAGGVSSIHSEELELAFVQPLPQAPVVGPTYVELRLSPAAAAIVKSVELRVDGEVLAKLTSAPWRALWQPADGSRGHQIEAVAHLNGGRSLHATVRTTGFRVDQVETVDLVNLYAIVSDRAGHYVMDLEPQHFRVLENGKPQKIERMTTERKPLRVGIVLDTSNSMGRSKGAKLKSAQQAAMEFLDVLTAEDQGMVVAFNDTVEVVQDLTSDVKSLARSIEGIGAQGGTALYDAVWKTARKLEEADGRRVVVLLSDGKDESASGLEPGSLHTLNEALDQALRSEVMLFAIAVGNHLESECVFSLTPLSANVSVCPGGTVADALRRLAESTGGRTLISPGTARLRKAFRDVGEDLRNQYSIAYVSDDVRRDGSWREINVSVPGRELEVITRKGYYAPRAVLPPVSGLTSPLAPAATGGLE